MTAHVGERRGDSVRAEPDRDSMGTGRAGTSRAARPILPLLEHGPRPLTRRPRRAARGILPAREHRAELERPRTILAIGPGGRGFKAWHTLPTACSLDRWPPGLDTLSKSASHDSNSATAAPCLRPQTPSSLCCWRTAPTWSTTGGALRSSDASNERWARDPTPSSARPCRYLPRS